jgi:hypothetical protein
MACVPVAVKEAESCAVPPLTVAVPSVVDVVLSVKVTVPVAAAGKTLAVSVTPVPVVVEVEEAASVVVVAVSAVLTVMLTALDVLLA